VQPYALDTPRSNASWDSDIPSGVSIGKAYVNPWGEVYSHDEMLERRKKIDAEDKKHSDAEIAEANRIESVRGLPSQNDMGQPMSTFTMPVDYASPRPNDKVPTESRPITRPNAYEHNAQIVHAFRPRPDDRHTTTLPKELPAVPIAPRQPQGGAESSMIIVLLIIVVIILICYVCCMCDMYTYYTPPKSVISY
jgi:hypothetical protein